MHGQPSKWKKDRSSPIKELLGKWLFVLYAILYVGFMAINVTSPSFMRNDVGGINVAIAYGVVLIIFAMILAFAYNHVCSTIEGIMNRPDDGASDDQDDASEEETEEDEE
jgi:hypothetical protein